MSLTYSSGGVNEATARVIQSRPGSMGSIRGQCPANLNTWLRAWYKGWKKYCSNAV